MWFLIQGLPLVKRAHGIEMIPDHLGPGTGYNKNPTVRIQNKDTQLCHL